jgi:hypothetical protein
MFGFNALGTLSPDGPTSIFSALLSSDNDVSSLEIGEKFGAKSGRKNPKDKIRQYEKN